MRFLKTLLPPLVVTAVLAGGAAAALNAPGSTKDSRTADRVTSRRYLEARYELATSIDGDLEHIVTGTEDAAREMSRQCSGIGRKAPRGADFGGLNDEALWTLVAVIWRERSATARIFAHATDELTWSDDALTRLNRALADEQLAEAHIAVRNVCRDMRSWQDSRYRTLPVGVDRFLREFLKVVAGGARAESARLAEPKHPKVRDCNKVTRICIETSAGPGGKLRHILKSQPPDAAMLQLVSTYGHGDDPRLVHRIKAMEATAARVEREAYLRAGRSVTRALGLEPAVLRSMMHVL